jgi:hypothetical protein
VHAGIAQREDQVLGNAAEAEAAAHHRHPVAHHVGERGLRARVDLADRHAWIVTGPVIPAKAATMKP